MIQGEFKKAYATNRHRALHICKLYRTMHILKDLNGGFFMSIFSIVKKILIIRLVSSSDEHKSKSIVNLYYLHLLV